jgi:uncharacterized protein
VTPLYLGSAERRIFGIHEPPAATGGRARAAVLCYPWGSEYVYAHRSMRQLAARLAMSGHHTLRFDYFGTGDSGGEVSQTDLECCESNVEAAMEAVRDMAGVSQVALVGLRVGANVAARAALRFPDQVAALVLWDPIVSGEEYVSALQSTPHMGSADTSDSPMLNDLRGIDLCAVIDGLPERTLIVATQPSEAYRRLSAAARATRLSLELVPAPCPWIESVTTTGASPVEVIRRIAEWLQ